MHYDYDLIIVGAGPAGSTMALFAARAGLRTLLLDKHTFPRDKICGDVIPPDVIPIIEELGLTSSLLARSPCCLKEWRVYADGDVLSWSGSEDTIVMPRRRFDAVLFEAAREVVDTLEGARVTSVLTDDGRATGVTGVYAGGQSFQFSGRVIAGADGYASIVARSMGVYRYLRDHMAVATRVYYRGVKQTTPGIEMYYDRRHWPDYFWIFPVGQDIVNVGYGRFLFHAESLSVRARHKALEQSPQLAARFAEAEALTPMKGWQLPLASTRRPIHGNGFVLLGDAAGLIDPFQGHGIDHAMRSGQLAAEAVAQACATGDVSAQGLASYAHAIDEIMGEYMAKRMKMRQYLPPNPWEQLFLKISLLSRFDRVLFSSQGVIRKQSEVEAMP